MKILLTLLFLAATPGFAATDDPADPSSANLQNLNYYLRPGGFRLEPSVSSAVNDIDGAYAESFENINLFAEFGLPLEGLRISVEMTDDLTARNGHLDSYYYSGLEDPTVYLNYRIIDATPRGWSADAQLSVTPSIGSPQLGSAMFPGTNVAEYTSLDATLAAFWRLQENEAQFFAGVAYRFQGTANSQITVDNTYTISDEWLGSAGIRDRFHVCPRFYVEAEGTLQFGHSHTDTYSDGATFQSSTNFHVEPEIAVGYEVTKQVVIGAHLNYDGYTVTNGSDYPIRYTNWGMFTDIEF